VIDVVAIRLRYDSVARILMRGELRISAASDARAAGRGGIAAVSLVTGIARSTIGRGLKDLAAGEGAWPGSDSPYRRCLRRDDCAKLIEDALLHFDGQRYKLLAWCIMPNHVHVMVECDAQHSLALIVQSWKSFTAKSINAVLRRTGRLWAADYFDRYARDDPHYAAIVSYIESDPVKAGFVESPQDWRWSSASRRGGVHQPQ